MILVAQEIPNLELLTPAENTSKGGALPATWLGMAYVDENDRNAIRALHHLGSITDDLNDFPEFTEQRRAKLAGVIRQRLGVPALEVA